MKRLLVLLIFMALPAKAEEAHLLKEKVVVSGNAVTLNDLLQIPIEQGDVAIFAAPTPGESGVINVTRAIEAVKSYGVENIPLPANTEIQVVREGRKIEMAELERLVAVKATQYLHTPAENITVSFSRPASDIKVEKTADAAPALSSFKLDPQSGRFEARLFVSNSAILKEASPAILAGTLHETAQVVRLKRELVRGQVVTANDIELARIGRQQMTINALHDAADIVGLAARRNLEAGATLRAGDLEKTKLVKRNEMVMITYETPAIVVTTRGKALADGTLGDVIDVQNLQSKRTIQVTVSGEGRVTAQAGPPPRRVAQITE